MNSSNLISTLSLISDEEFYYQLAEMIKETREGIIDNNTNQYQISILK